MSITCSELPMARLADYARISMAFEVRTFLRPERIGAGLGGITLEEAPVTEPYEKNYDAYDPPAMWPKRFNTRHWTLLAASDDATQEIVGGLVIACRTPNLELLEDRDDLALIWDIRVAPRHRRSGVGRTLMAQAVGWARARRYRQLKVETQNTNLAACRFYASCGCTLGSIKLNAYPEIPGEAMLLWYHDLE